MTDSDSATAAMAGVAEEEVRLPDGEYAIVEVLGHRTMIGRVTEVERFGTKLCGIEPLFAGQLLPMVMVGGGSIYQMTPCSAEIAAKRMPSKAYQLPSSVAVTLLPELLPAPSTRASYDDECDEDEVAF